MIIRRIAPFSLAKLAGFLYALMGLLIGGIISAVSLVGFAFVPKDEGGAAGMLFGVAAILFLPILYGVLGFVMSLIAAALYNLIAGWVGGIEIDVE